MRYLPLLLLFLLAFGCGPEDTNDSSDCRMADSECATGFSCQMNPVGAYECLPAGEEPTAGEPTAGEEPIAGEEPTAGQERITVEDSRTGVTWVNIPAGSFMMGSSFDDTELPIHQVTVQTFQMSQTEVTVRQYRKCVEAGRCLEPYIGGDKCTWSESPSDTEDHPINCVEWRQARTFAVWVGGDLLTEAQWEYAARGGEDYEYAGSDNADAVAWYSPNSVQGTREVKTKRANGYGLYDMSGNVSEWVLDEWHPSYQFAPSQAETPWGEILPCSRICDIGSSRRVIRGGSWNSGAGYVRVASRVFDTPGGRYNSRGFRVRRTLP